MRRMNINRAVEQSALQVPPGRCRAVIYLFISCDVHGLFVSFFIHKTDIINSNTRRKDYTIKWYKLCYNLRDTGTVRMRPQNGGTETRSM